MKLIVEPSVSTADAVLVQRTNHSTDLAQRTRQSNGPESNVH